MTLTPIMPVDFAAPQGTRLQQIFEGEDDGQASNEAGRFDEI